MALTSPTWVAPVAHTWLEGSGLATDSPRLEPRPVRRPVLAALILPAVTQGVTPVPLMRPSHRAKFLIFLVTPTGFEPVTLRLRI